MNGYDITFGTRTILLVPPTAETVTNTATGQDVSRFFGRVALAVDVGTVTAGGTLSVQLQDSDTLGGTYANIAGALVSVVAADANVSKSVGVDVNPLRAFVRVVLTVGGATPTINCSVRFSGYFQ